jgi:hypothetical protein
MWFVFSFDQMLEEISRCGAEDAKTSINPAVLMSCVRKTTNNQPAPTRH